MNNYFITGTDTDAGKTVVTALIADYFKSQGGNVITQKWLQTGNINFSEDLEYHLNFMEEELNEEFKELICPYIFKFPASPHLAASLENREVDKTYIIDCYKKLAENFEAVLVEGSGGVLVPYDQKNFVIDITKDLQLETIIVSLNKLGSINHTLMTIEVLKARRIKIKGIIFNNAPQADSVILADNIEIIKKISQVPILGVVPFSFSKEELRASFVSIGKKL
ncbi:MAG: dethiobiotin synthase [bacterium]|nr:dethiobiotin synthase [bacterium]